MSFLTSLTYGNYLSVNFMAYANSQAYVKSEVKDIFPDYMKLKFISEQSTQSTDIK